MKGLEIRKITKIYQEEPVLQGISFQQNQGEILALLGPSGSGKSTLLEIIAGLVEPDSGDCLWDGESLAGVPPHLRGFGLMFQEYVLFPHKNVQENIAFGLKMSGKALPETTSRVKEVLKLVGLSGFEDRDVNTLSGGEQQRVALARSLAPEPRLVMLDEPLGALDRTIRERLVGDLKKILNSARQTALYVTHDQEEAFSIADRVVIIGEGTAVQIGTPQEIYYQPGSPYVARFLGMDNLLEGEAQPNSSGCLLKTKLGEWQVSRSYKGKGLILLRPDQIKIDPDSKNQAVFLRGTVRTSTFSGSALQIELDVVGTLIHFSLPDPGLNVPKPGKALSVSFKPDAALHFFSKE
jgi:ABC-type Fe3+/spermidine/putrescine transport system ATPase subunit